MCCRVQCGIFDSDDGGLWRPSTLGGGGPWPVGMGFSVVCHTDVWVRLIVFWAMSLVGKCITEHIKGQNRSGLGVRRQVPRGLECELMSE